MFSNINPSTVAHTDFFNSQLAALKNLSAITTQGAEKIIALNTSISKAASDNFMMVTKDLLAAKDPSAFFTAQTQATPNLEQFTAYNGYLSSIFTDLKTELTKVAETQVADMQNKVSELVSGQSKTVPSSSQGALTMMQSVIDNANSSYGQFIKTSRQFAGFAEN